MATKTTAAVSILAVVAALFAFCANTEAIKEPAREAAAKERIILVATYPVGDFIAPLDGFEEYTKIEGHTKKEVIDAFNQCKILIFDRQEWSKNDWTFPPIHGKGWPKFLLEGETMFRLGEVTLGVKGVEIGGSTTWPQRRTVGIWVKAKRVNQGDLSKFKEISSQSCTWVDYNFIPRHLKYDCEGKATLLPVKEKKSE